MQFTPKSEKQLIEESLLPAGEYDFRVLSAEDKVSKNSGKPMIQLELEIYDADGRTRKCRDYLMESMGFKLRHFAFAVGLGPQYESGALLAADMVERTGRVEIRQEPAKGDFAARNGVKDYVVPEAVEKAPEAPSPIKPAGAGGSTDEPPFMRLSEWG